MAESVDIKEIKDQMLKDLWLSDQLTYTQYMSEVKRRKEARKPND